MRSFSFSSLNGNENVQFGILHILPTNCFSFSRKQTRWGKFVFVREKKYNRFCITKKLRKSLGNFKESPKQSYRAFLVLCPQ